MIRARSLHSAFALTIESEIPLIELPAGQGRPDVTVTIGRVADAPPPSSSWTVVAAPDRVSGWIPAGGGFCASGGAHIVIEPAPAADERALRLAVIGPLMGVILAQRGAFVLHASTVAIDGVAAAFVGPSGRGKSTLAAALIGEGHCLIADDMTVVEVTEGRPFAHPGFPRVKLWPDAAASLAHDVDRLPLIHPDVTKRSLELPTLFHSGRLPLRRCYLVEDGEEERVSDMTPTQAILALVGCTYQSSWMHDTGTSGPNLLHCGGLARSGVVRTLSRRRTYASLSEVIRFVEADVRAAHQAQGS